LTDCLDASYLIKQNFQVNSQSRLFKDEEKESGEVLLDFFCAEKYQGSTKKNLACKFL